MELKSFHLKNDLGGEIIEEKLAGNHPPHHKNILGCQEVRKLVKRKATELEQTAKN